MNKTNASPGACYGFTLLELAIVFVILSLLVGVSVTLGAAQINAARYAQTYSKMDAIEKALLAYRRANNRLPCPASLTLPEGTTDFGTEAGAAGDCTATGVNSLSGGSGRAREGAVPVVTLGLPGDFMFDGWGERFDYGVDKNATYANAFIDPLKAYPISNTAIGDIQIYDASNSQVTTQAVYVLVSFGENAIGGYNAPGAQNTSYGSADERNNCNCGFGAGIDNVWVQKEMTGNMSDATNYFDDIVHYKMRWQLPGYDE